MGFKEGDKVVYIGGAPETRMNYPKVNTEVCEISSFFGIHNGYDYYVIAGYEKNLEGEEQYISGKRLRKVEPKSAKNKLSAKLVEDFKESQIIWEVDTIDKPIPVDA